MHHTVAKHGTLPLTKYCLHALLGRTVLAVLFTLPASVLLLALGAVGVTFWEVSGRLMARPSLRPTLWTECYYRVLLHVGQPASLSHMGCIIMHHCLRVCARIFAPPGYLQFRPAGTLTLTSIHEVLQHNCDGVLAGGAASLACTSACVSTDCVGSRCRLFPRSCARIEGWQGRRAAAAHCSGRVHHQPFQPGRRLPPPMLYALLLFGLVLSGKLCHAASSPSLLVCFSCCANVLICTLPCGRCWFLLCAVHPSSSC